MLSCGLHKERRSRPRTALTDKADFPNHLDLTSITSQHPEGWLHPTAFPQLQRPPSKLSKQAAKQAFPISS